jgi:hypothetical protein
VKHLRDLTTFRPGDGANHPADLAMVLGTWHVFFIRAGMCPEQARQLSRKTLSRLSPEVDANQRDW